MVGGGRATHASPLRYGALPLPYSPLPFSFNQLRWALLAFVFLVAVLPGHASGQTVDDVGYADLTFRGIGAEIGQIIPDEVEPTLYTGLRVDLGFVGPRVRVIPSTRFWSSRLRDAEVERLATQIVLVCERQVAVDCPDSLDLGELKLSDLELSLDA